MARIQDIDIPYLEFAEAAAPGTPAAAVSRLYVKADGLFYSKDDAGVETLVSGGAGGGTPAAVGCRITRTATQTISTATYTSVLFTATDIWDSNAFHDPASNSDRAVVPAGKSGYYNITGWLSWANSTAGTFRFARLVASSALGVVGVHSFPFHSNVGLDGVASANGVYLAAGEWMAMDCYQDTGGNLNVTAATLGMTLVGT